MILKVDGQISGLANSNYLATQSMLLNPSSTADPGNHMEAQLLGLNVFAKNNYINIPKNGMSIGQISSITLEDNFFEQKRYTGHIETDLQFISVTKAIEKFGFGLSFRGRAYGNFRNTPSHLAKFFFEGFGYNRQHGQSYEAGDFAFKSMSWGELNLNFSMIAYQMEHSLIKVGGNLKRLWGFHNLGLYINEVDYEVYRDTLDIDLFTGRYGMAVPEADGNGKGWGLDLGITYVKTDKPCTYYIPFARSQRCQKLSYDYKLGLSLLDIGGIRFNESTRLRDFDKASTVWSNYSETPTNSLGVLDNYIVWKFEPTNPNIGKDSSFVASLPTSIALEIDKRFGKYFYLNATGLLPAQFRRNLGVSRLGFFAFTPRFELSMFEASMPITLNTFKSPDVGLMVRSQGFFIGTNNLLPYLGMTKFWGISFYFGFRAQFGTTQTCREELRKNKNFWCPGC